MNYQEFLEMKKITPIISGFDVDAESLNENLFDFQRVIVKWALKRGRAAIFADTGLGKTLMQTSWAQSVVDHTDGDVLIVAPLCVAQQTVREGVKFGIDIHFCRDQVDAKSGINITNYEMLDRFNLDDFHGIVLDESSIIKNRDGKTRNAIIAACQSVPYRLSCTATPSPNDFMELGNQSEFLGIMNMVEMLAMFFINDAGDTGTWILKGHGKAKFWEWLSTWACVIRSPSDLGFDGSAYVLPKLNMFDHVVESKTTDGLFADIACGLMDRNKARKESIDDRVEKCAEVVNASSEQWVIWCHRNEEADKLVKLIVGAVDVSGSDSIEHKEESVNGFIDGGIRVLVSKPKILGAGMNFQHCHNTAFVGLSDSWEQYYQAIRRFYRFGQESEVNVHVISAESEDPVVAMQRTKALGLLHKTIKKDSSMSRQGLADYLVVFRKPGQNEKFISHTAEEFPVQMWQKYASPVWFDIDQSRTLNFRDAREEDDVKHICPLQLDVIERAMNLWTAPDDLVFSPFTGVGSEGFTAVKMGRRFIGSELKPSYYDQAIKNMASAKSQNLDLFAAE